MDIWTVFWRDWLVLTRRIGRFVLSRMIAPVLYLTTFGWGLGRGIQVNGSSYLEFIVPGIMALNAMNISFNAVASPLSMSRIFYKTIEEYLLAPISPASFVIGKILAGTVQGFLSTMVVYILACVFGAKIIINGWFIMILILTCVLFAALGFVSAMLINSHEEMSNFSTYVLMPMSFFCGTFFSLDKLPWLLREFIQLLPLTHASYPLRTIGLGGEVSWFSIGVLTFYIAVLMIIGLWTIKKIRD